MPNTQTTFQSFKTVLGFTSVSLSTILFLNYGKVNAATIKITDPTPTYSASIQECFGFDGTKYKGCTSDAYVSTTAIKGADAVKPGSGFRKSFDTWNAGNPAGQMWTLANGGELNAVFEVSTFDAFAEPYFGGVEIQIDFNYAGADRADFFWSQGVNANFRPGVGFVSPPVFDMDVDSTPPYANTRIDPSIPLPSPPPTFAPPLYPFQYTDGRFYDRPSGRWPNSFFNAQLFISKVDYTNRVLTIYDGVSWGFKLSVPEPSAGIASFMAVIGVMALVRRNRQSNNS
ncbi:hypothetical protein [Microcystis aeruginosa]|uniref:PEP-CTERM protein-sorting domain-containing protein n=1 Tax=Microcystis aeruginosa PCC 9443 TaxID=1160281 RepID=I4FYR9_MICAE|nr:hypothetical protein [Microcystis aeruginosa]CCI00830.1 conserved exported hypothetical protein [Microcystis aeruginosa PCC 9443]